MQIASVKSEEVTCAVKKLPLPVLPNLGTRSIPTLILGCDPEFFLKKDGKTVGSEKLIPVDGIQKEGLIIRDGFQVELNPRQSYCRKLLAASIQEQLSVVSKLAQKSGMEIDMSITVPITQEEMDSVSSKSKQFGCTASYNVYEDDASVGVPDGSKYMSRSAGGHIHLGNDGDANLLKVLQDAKRIVPVIDLLVGNTFVMFDRDEGNVIRRKTYGRAGEFRLPKHGLEYRTLSNYWLNNYTLMSIAFGLIRQAVKIVLCSTKENDYAGQLMSLVNINDVRDAINNNDRELAMSNFNKIKDFILSIDSGNEWEFDVLSRQTIKGFEMFIANPEKYPFKSNNTNGGGVVGRWLDTYNNYGVSEGAEKFFTRIANDGVVKEPVYPTVTFY